MSACPFRLIPPDPREHLLPMAQMVADVFTEGKYVEQFSQNYIGNSHYDSDVSRIMLDGEKIIQHWGVWGYQMRLESIELRVAGVGAVATLADYRKQGLMHQAAQVSFEAMDQAGYDLSMLQGKHYAKMGYTRAWNFVSYKIKLEDLPDLGQPGPYQPLGIERVGEMDALYNQVYAGFSGTAVRPTYRNRHPNDLGVYAWLDPAGTIEGYVRALPSEDDPKILWASEAAGDPRQGLAVLADLFKNGGYEGLECITFPHDHPLLQLLRRGTCSVEECYLETAGWRVRVINLPGALQKLVPVLERRLAQSVLAGWWGTLLLDGSGRPKTSGQTVLLRIENSRVTVSAEEHSENWLCGGPALGRLLIGSDEPEEVIRQEEMQCSGMAQPLARVLFPNLHPVMS